MTTLPWIKQWNVYHALVMVVSVGGVLLLDAAWPLLTGAGLSFAGLFLRHRDWLWGTMPLGSYANWVTTLRLLLVFALGMSYGLIHPWIAATLALLIISLDGIDGYLARRYQQTSSFGVYLDMETDAFFVAVLTTSYYLYDQLGAWILFFGWLRYFYILLVRLFRLGQKQETSTRFAKTIAIIFFISLLLPLALPRWLYFPAVILGCGLVLYSFAVSFISLLRD